jgi:hypothetical protein
LLLSLGFLVLQYSDRPAEELRSWRTVWIDSEMSRIRLGSMHGSQHRMRNAVEVCVHDRDPVSGSERLVLIERPSFLDRIAVGVGWQPSPELDVAYFVHRVGSDGSDPEGWREFHSQ